MARTPRSLFAQLNALAEEISQNPASLGIINEIVGMNMIQKLRDVEPPLEPQTPPSMGVPPEEEPIQ